MYETQAGLPTKGLTYAQIMEKLRELQELYAMMAHIHNAQGTDGDALLARGWLGMEQLTKRIAYQVTELAKRGLQ